MGLVKFLWKCNFTQVSRKLHIKSRHTCACLQLSSSTFFPKVFDTPDAPTVAFWGSMVNAISDAVKSPWDFANIFKAFFLLPFFWLSQAGFLKGIWTVKLDTFITYSKCSKFLCYLDVVDKATRIAMLTLNVVWRLQSFRRHKCDVLEDTCDQIATAIFARKN